MLKRVVLLPYNKAKVGFDINEVRIGELVVDTSTGEGFVKGDDGHLYPFNSLMEFINDSTAFGETPAPKATQSFQIVPKKYPDKTAYTGVFKIRTPDTSNPGNTYFREVRWVTDGEVCMIDTGKVDPDSSEPIYISTKEFYESYVAFSVDVSTNLALHKTKIEALEKVVYDMSTDRNLFYTPFTQVEANDLVYKISPDHASATEVFNNDFQVICVLDMDQGHSVNKYHIGLRLDNANNKYWAYARDLGDAVQARCLIYHKNGFIYIRPTPIDGEIIIKDISPRKGSFVNFNGLIEAAKFSESGLTGKDLINPIGLSETEDASSYYVTQVGHGFPPMAPAYYDVNDTKWKLALASPDTTKFNGATALAITLDEDTLQIVASGHVKVPDDAKTDTGVAIPYGMMFVSETVTGGIQVDTPKRMYQELGFKYTKNGDNWFAVSIGIPISQVPDIVADLATKAEVKLRQRVVQSVDVLDELNEPEGTAVTVADVANWHYRKIEATKKDSNSIQTQNGLWANIVPSDGATVAELNKKFDIGNPDTEGATLEEKFNNAIKMMKEIQKRLEIPSDYTEGWNGLMSKFDDKLNKSAVVQTTANPTADTVPSMALFMANIGNGGGGTGANVLETPPYTIWSGMLSAPSYNTISCPLGLMEDILVFLNGEFVHPEQYTLNKENKTITLTNPGQSSYIYTVVDWFPTDIKFVADTPAAAASSTLLQLCVVGDVIKCLGTNQRYDGKHHLRIITNNNSGEDPIDIGDGKFLCRVPNTYIAGLEPSNGVQFYGYDASDSKVYANKGANVLYGTVVVSSGVNSYDLNLTAPTWNNGNRPVSALQKGSYVQAWCISADSAAYQLEVKANTAIDGILEPGANCTNKLVFQFYKGGQPYTLTGDTVVGFQFVFGLERDI